jgi:hypothetical protein
VFSYTTSSTIYSRTSTVRKTALPYIGQAEISMPASLVSITEYNSENFKRSNVHMMKLKLIHIVTDMVFATQRLPKYTLHH